MQSFFSNLILVLLSYFLMIQALWFLFFLSDTRCVPALAAFSFMIPIYMFVSFLLIFQFKCFLCRITSPDFLNWSSSQLCHSLSNYPFSFLLITHCSLKWSWLYATGLEKVIFIPSLKEGQCQRMVRLTIQFCSFHMLVDYAQNPSHHTLSHILGSTICLLKARMSCCHVGFLWASSLSCEIWIVLEKLKGFWKPLNHHTS